MRRPFFALLIAPAAATALHLAGCAAPPKSAEAPPEGEPVEQSAADAEAMAERAAAQLAAQGPIAPPDVQWIEPGSPTPQAAIQPGPAPTPPTEPVAPPVEFVTAPEPAPPAPEPATEAPAPAPVVEAPPASTDQLLSQLMERISGSDAPALDRAIDAATLSVLAPEQTLDEELLKSLGYEQRDLVERYHQVLGVLTQSLSTAEGTLDRAAVDKKLDELFGYDPIRIRRVELCKRVTGYGIYEPFENNSFMAGRENKAIVYVELDQFQSSELGEGQFEVKLQQELALFNESDGLAVWRNEPVEIVDNSRNRRRDFFVVQLVTLPPRLSVGKFRLKVRVTDLHGGAIDETTVPIEVVADEKLVQGGSKAGG